MMLGNYIKVVIRSFKRHKTIATINVIGLAIGMATALLTILWVHHEWSFDRYHQNSERVYRVIIQTESEGRIDSSAITPAPCASALQREFPWIETSARFIRRDRIVTLNNRTIRSEILVADPTIFNVFTIPIIRGNKNSPLQSQKDILISETMARRYFPRKDPIGETITLGDKEELRISGVFRDIPDNSHFTFHLLTSLHTIPPSHQVNWGIRNYYTYLLAKKDAHIDPTAAITTDFVDTYIGAQIRKQFNFAFHLQPLHDIHLHSDIRNEYQPNGSLYNLTLFLLAGCFILLIACLNYINLTTAWYAGRHQEVGLRKVLGASPSHILRQFLVESFLISIIATPAAMVLAKWFLPIFNTLTGKNLSINILKNPWIFLSSIAIIIVTSLISGVVPALFMLRANPIHTLKGTPHRQSDNPSSRQILVVFQFTLSITFMIVALIIAQQVDYMKTRDPGLATHNIINIPIDHNPTALQKHALLKQEFLNHPNVLSVSASAFTPGKTRWSNNYKHELSLPNDTHMINCIPVDHDFLTTFGIQLTQGRDFSPQFPTDAGNAFIINQAAQKEFGFPNPIGKQLTISNWKQGPIIGVVKDFHYNSLHQTIHPLALYIHLPHYEYFSVRVAPNHIPQTIVHLQAQWQQHIPNQPFAYTILQNDINRLYKNETNLQHILAIITLLSIFIASLGLFGLAAFTANRRTKEIAIRKVLGAPTHTIIALLTQHFTRWILLANILAWPAAYFFIANWFLRFPYRIPIPLTTFILSALTALLIALLTITHHTLKTAGQNPAQTLRQH